MYMKFNQKMYNFAKEECVMKNQVDFQFSVSKNVSKKSNNITHIR